MAVPPVVDRRPHEGPGASGQNERWWPSLGLFALAVSGHAAALSIIDSPPFSVYQHFLPWSVLREQRPLGLFVLAFQAIVCIVLAYRARRELAAGARRVAPRWLLLASLALLAFSSAIPAESIGRFAGEAGLSFATMLVSALNYILIALVLPGRPLSLLRDAISRRLTISTGDDGRAWDRRLPFIAALWVAVVSGAIAALVFERIPHIDDSLAYLFQATHMSTGALWLPRPPDVDSFGIAHLLVDGDKWYSKFFPGWPLLLTLGVSVGLPWLVNPLLAAASVVLTHRLIRRLYNLRTAHAVTILVSVSPWLLFLSGSMLAHAASLFWMLVALVAIDAQRDRTTNWLAPLAGFALGMIFLTRPFDAALVGPMIGLWAIGFGARRLPVAAVLIIGVTAAAVAGLYFVYNDVMTGNAFLAPHQLWGDRIFGPGVDVFGFGPDVGNIPMWRNQDPLPGHGLADVILNDNKNFTLTNFELFGWSFGSLVFTCLAFQRGGLQRRDILLVGIVVSVIGGHSFYWVHGGPDFGARYWYLAIVPLALLTVRGVEMAAARLSTQAAHDSRAGTAIVAIVALSTISALTTMAPWRAAVKYDRYRDIGRDFQTIAERQHIEHALIFVRSPRRSDYQAAFTFNPSLDDRGNIFVRDLGGEHARAVLAHYPERPVWVVGRDKEDDPTIDVIAGALPPGTAPPGTPVSSDVTFQIVVR